MLGTIQAKVVSQLAQKFHWQYTLQLEALIKRYEVAMWLAFTKHVNDPTYATAHESLLPHQTVEELKEIGTLYIEQAASLGHERALRDLVNSGWLKWYYQPIKASSPKSVQFNSHYLDTSFKPALAATTNTLQFRARITMYSHYLWRAADNAYQQCIGEFTSFAKYKHVREAEADDEDFEAVFAGPDDSETCDGCDYAVNNNPYTMSTVPEPGSFECMSRCRHFTQLADNAPDDLAPYQWRGTIGFGNIPSKYYQDVTADQDLLPGDAIGPNDLASPYSPDVTGFDALDGAIDIPEGKGLPFDHLYHLVSTSLEDAVNNANQGNVDDLASWLWNTGLAPEDITEDMWPSAFRDEYLGALEDRYAQLLTDNGNRETALELLRVGQLDQLQLLIDGGGDDFMEILISIAAEGFDPSQGSAAALLGKLLGKEPVFVSEIAKWIIQ